MDDAALAELVSVVIDHVADPIFIKETLQDPNTKFRQGAGTIHVHPNGRFVYQAHLA